MIPVLSLKDPVSGAAFLRDRLAFTADPADPMLLARDGQLVRLARADAPVAGLIDLPFDHLAIWTADVETVQTEAHKAGAVLHADFTPDGPCEIAEFGPSGVRYVFFEGPEGSPFEFVAPRGAGGGRGHAHFGLRCPVVAEAAERLRAMGAKTVAHHRLGGPQDSVEVEFLSFGDSVFEVFDAPPPPGPPRRVGWIGFVA